MDFNVGDKVFYTCSNGVCVPATVVGLPPEGLIHLEYFQDAIKVVNRRRQKWYQPYGPWEHIPSSIWAEEEAPEVDEDDDDTYLCQVCGRRDTSECSICDHYLCSSCMREHTCEIEVPE